MDLYLIPPEEALRLMEQTRTCPPLDLLMQGGADIDAHLASCPFCRELAQRDRKKYASLESFLRSLPSPEPGGPVQAGEVRQISREAVPDIHDEHGWHNPPLALVIHDEEAVGIPGVVRVAPLFDKPSLAFVGDIPLRSLKQNLFAESWNTFALLSRFLEGVIGIVNQKELDKVREWEDKAIPKLAEGTAQSAFRRMERSIAGFYGRYGAAQALALWEQSASAPPKTSGGAKIHVFSLSDRADIRRKASACSQLLYEHSAPVRPDGFLAAADAPPVPLDKETRTVLNNFYGPAKKGAVNVYTLDFAAGTSSHEERTAEFRMGEDEKYSHLHVLLPWEKGVFLWEAAVMLSEDEPELWIDNKDIEEEPEGCISLFLKLAEGTRLDPTHMKVLLFAEKKA